ncbi:MAG TPA: hypothetical protein VIG24_06555 [Acidimicrobiia bacterium]
MPYVIQIEGHGYFGLHEDGDPLNGMLWVYAEDIAQAKTLQNRNIAEAVVEKIRQEAENFPEMTVVAI